MQKPSGHDDRGCITTCVILDSKSAQTEQPSLCKSTSSSKATSSPVCACPGQACSRSCTPPGTWWQLQRSHPCPPQSQPTRSHFPASHRTPPAPAQIEALRYPLEQFLHRDLCQICKQTRPSHNLLAHAMTADTLTLPSVSQTSSSTCMLQMTQPCSRYPLSKQTQPCCQPSSQGQPCQPLCAQQQKAWSEMRTWSQRILTRQLGMHAVNWLPHCLLVLQALSQP